MDWNTLFVSIASGIILGALGFGARALLGWWREREDSEFWPADTKRLLMQMYRHQGRAILRRKKERFVPPYTLDRALVGDEMFEPSDLGYLKHVGLVEEKATSELLIGKEVMLETEHSVTRRGARWAKRLIRREERALASIRP